MPSGISASQFTRWHLDHHAELGSYEEDPKRHYLSPKINARWLKFLYFTPALFPIYFRAAEQETASYEPEMRKRIARERIATIVFQLAILAAIALIGGPWIAFKLYVVPVFFVFPIAFALNRLGQHYDINPDDAGAVVNAREGLVVLGRRSISSRTTTSSITTSPASRSTTFRVCRSC